ncbi:hypothetical protein [Rubritalea marina]|uniref:hypothetical protein n=1 Tax=Rubritalea marina TaxID=361055 RepID=UPI00035C36EF|nr:hypothetical protein [Rubritalea marina]
MKILIKACVACLALLIGVSNTVVAQNNAAAAAKAKKAPSSLSITAPKDGSPVSYSSGGKTFTVKPGETVTLPAGAKDIKVPTGAVLQAVHVKKNKTKTVAKMSVMENVVLPQLTAKDIKSKLNVANCVIVSLLMFEPKGSLKEYEFKNPFKKNQVILATEIDKNGVKKLTKISGGKVVVTITDLNGSERKEELPSEYALGTGTAISETIALTGFQAVNQAVDQVQQDAQNNDGLAGSNAVTGTQATSAATDE